MEQTPGGSCKQHPAKPLTYVIKDRSLRFFEGCEECMIKHGNIQSVRPIEDLKIKWQQILAPRAKKAQFLPQAIRNELNQLLTSLEVKLPEQTELEQIVSQLRGGSITDYLSHQLQIDQMRWVQQRADLLREEVARNCTEILNILRVKANYFKGATENLRGKWRQIKIRKEITTNYMSQSQSALSCHAEQSDNFITQVQQGYMLKFEPISPINQLSLLREQISALKEETKQLKCLRASYINLKQQDQANYVTNLKLQGELQQAHKSKFDIAAKELECQKIREKMEQLRQTLNKQLAQLQDNQRIQQNQNIQLKQDLEKLNIELQNSQKQNNRLKQQNGKLDQLLNESSDSLKLKNNQLSISKLVIEQHTNKLKDQQTQLLALKQMIQNLQNKLTVQSHQNTKQTTIQKIQQLDANDIIQRGDIDLQPKEQNEQKEIKQQQNQDFKQIKESSEIKTQIKVEKKISTERYNQASGKNKRKKKKKEQSEDIDEQLR